jgi:cytochrome c-type biogenesis protein
MQPDFSAIRNASAWAFLLVFVGGIVTSIGPCNVAMIPLVIAFVGGQRQVTRGRSLALSAAFALGLAITLTALGVIASLAGGLIGGNTRLWYYLVASVCIVMGLQWAGVLALPLPDIAARQREKVQARGLLGALALGLVSGLAASGCATPALAAILTLAMAKGATLYGAALLLVYGLGRGVPIIAIGTFAGLVRAIPALVRWSSRLEQLSGGLMVLVGLYFLWIA